MTLKYKLLNSGAFVAGDVDTGITSYAYQSSVYATEARRRPRAIAETMVSGESPYMHVSDYAKGYDLGNWELLGGRE